MALLHSLRLSAFALLSTALWGGCCANNVCAADDPLADAVKLRFSSRFAVNDLDTLTILRYPKDSTGTVRPETVTLVRGAVPPNGDEIIINNNTPFSRVGNTNLGNYRYRVQYLAHPGGVNKPVVTTALVISSILVQGRYDADGCCTKYTNTAKTVSYDSSRIIKSVNLMENPYLLIR